MINKEQALLALSLMLPACASPKKAEPAKTKKLSEAEMKARKEEREENKKLWQEIANSRRALQKDLASLRKTEKYAEKTKRKLEKEEAEFKIFKERLKVIKNGLNGSKEKIEAAKTQIEELEAEKARENLLSYGDHVYEQVPKEDKASVGDMLRKISDTSNNNNKKVIKLWGALKSLLEDSWNYDRANRKEERPEHPGNADRASRLY